MQQKRLTAQTDDDYNGPDPLENSDEDSASMKSTESNEDDVSFI